MILQRFFILLMLISIPGVYLFSQNDPWDMDLDAILPEEPPEEAQDAHKPAVLSFQLDIWNHGKVWIPGDSPLNPHHFIELDDFVNESSVQFRGTLFPGRAFRLNTDLSGALIYSFSNDYADREYEFQGHLNELYLQYFPSKWSRFSLECGRKIISPGNSYVFSIFQPFAREEQFLKKFRETEEGSDLAALGFLGEQGDLTLFYVEDSKSLNLYGNLLLNRLLLTGFLFGDTQWNWLTGGGYSLELGNRTLLYSDLSLSRSPFLQREEKGDDLVFRGTLLGVNLSLDSWPDILTELFYNSSGYTHEEWEEYNDFIRSISSTEALQSPMAGSYYGILGTQLADYDPFRIASWLLYFRFYDSPGKRDYVEWALSCFFSLLDYSSLLQASLKGEISPHWKWEISGNIILGNEGSIFDYMPYRGSAGLFLGYQYD